MKSNIVAAAIVAVGLIIASFLYAGRYYLVRLDGQSVAKLDRWTGNLKLCNLSDLEWGGGCHDVPEWKRVTAGEASTMNVDETLTTENVIANDITAVDASPDRSSK